MTTQTNVYDVGETVRAWATFRAATFSVAAGVPSATYALTDPTTVSLVVTEPDGTRTTYTYAGGGVTRHSSGVFYRDISLASAGEWALRWAGTGAAAATEESMLKARATRSG